MTAKSESRIAPVVKTVIVACTPEKAFHYFTAHLDKWWPLATHSCVAYASGHTETAASCEFEPRQGGRVFERSRAGEEHVWGTVVAWEPPSLVSFTWHPMRDAKTAQTVEVRFSAVAGGTEVVLTHGGWEALGDTAAQERDSYNEGWEEVFAVAYGQYVARQG